MKQPRVEEEDSDVSTSSVEYLPKKMRSEKGPLESEPCAPVFLHVQVLAPQVTFEHILADAGFVSSFMGRYLTFRDAWSLAQTCKKAHHCMTGRREFLTAFTRRVLSLRDSSVHPVHANAALTEWDYISQLPVSSGMNRTSFGILFHERFTRPGNGNDWATRRDYRVVMAMSADLSDLHLHEMPKFELTEAVLHMGLAKDVLALVAKMDEHTGEKWLRKWLDTMHDLPPVVKMLDELPPKRRGQKKQKGGGGEGSLGLAWNECFSVLLTSWANGGGGCMSEWAPGQWMQRMLKFLLHAVDLSGSVWESYLVDPLYVGFYKQAHFAGEDLDFWSLVNCMFANGGIGCQVVSPGKFVAPMRMTTHFDSGFARTIHHNPSGRLYDQAFLTVYQCHNRLAQTLRRRQRGAPVAFTAVGEQEDSWSLKITKLHKTEMALPDGESAIIEVRDNYDNDYPFSLVAHHGPLTQPELLAVVSSDGMLWPGHTWSQWKNVIPL